MRSICSLVDLKSDCGEKMIECYGFQNSVLRAEISYFHIFIFIMNIYVFSPYAKLEQNKTKSRDFQEGLNI